MILRAYPENRDEIRRLCGNDALGTRIYGTFLAYGDETPGVAFWISPDAIFGLTDGALTIAGRPDETHRDEIRFFVESIGPQAIVCAPETAELLGLKIVRQGPALVRENPGETVPCGGVERAEALGLRKLCGFLCDCETETFQVPEAGMFYIDVSHRVRHGAADGVLFEHEGTVLACALAGAVTETDALISAVAVLPQVRRRGLGRLAVDELCERLRGRCCHALRAEDENAEFYAALGFEENGRWAECTL